MSIIQSSDDQFIDLTANEANPAGEKPANRLSLLDLNLLKVSRRGFMSLMANAIRPQSPRIRHYSEMDPDRPQVPGTNSLYVRPHSEYFYHNMDKVGFALDFVKKGETTFALPRAEQQLEFEYSFFGKTYSQEDFITRGNVLGTLLVYDGKIVFERYTHGASRTSRFLTQSAGKSITGLLTGIAIEEGKIGSENDLVTTYLPYLKKTAYEGVTVKHLFQMATGIKFKEDYSGKPDSDVPQLYRAILRGSPTIKEIAQRVTRERNPGTESVYQSLNSFVQGFVIEAATNMRLHEYESKKIWGKIGAIDDAFHYRAVESSESCAAGNFCARAEDYARLGWMLVNQGQLPGQSRVISPEWITNTLTPDPKVKGLIPQKSPEARLKNGVRSYGYNNNWYLPEGEEKILVAWGAFGQMLYINLSQKTVGVVFSAWNVAEPLFLWDEQVTAMNAASKALQSHRK